MAHQLGRALSSLVGGLIVDGLLSVSNNNAMVAYGTAFMFEAVLLVGAMMLISHIDLEEAKLSVAQAGERLTAVPAPTD